MNRTTRLKKPQIPELDTLYQFNDLGGRPKYGGVEMTSETDIPSFQEIMDETHSAVVAEATARDDADDALQAQIDSLDSDLTAETTAREAADQAEATARAAADQAETTARTSADNNLQTQIDAIVASSDVKDIVGTYAELQAYDTSTLGDNDIIKVLQDETHQDETTYYRWVLADEEFSLIGEEGPYYTKAATDALLNNKADKDTTYTKTETDAALALKADKATTYTKTETDTLLGGKQDTLTAGDNITIANNVISAQAGVKEILTTDSDFNTNIRTFMDTHEAGVYKITNPTNSNVQIYQQQESANEPQLTFYVKGNSSVIYVFGKATSGMPKCAVFGAYTSAGDFKNFIAWPGVQYGLSVLDKQNINDLNGGSSRGNTALDARQGKVLNDKIEGRVAQNAGAPTTATAGTVGKLLEDTTNGDLYICTAVDTTTDPSNPSYTWEEVGGGSGPTVVQTTGTSTTDVMSQNAVTSMVYGDTTLKQKVRIGTNANTDSGSYQVAIGYSAKATNSNGGVAVGYNSFNQLPYAVALGAYSRPTQKGQMDISTLATTNDFGYNGSQYRLLTGLYDPQNAHDAATKGYVDTAVAGAGANTISSQDWSDLWQ